MESWYVLQTHFAQEKRAEAHLLNQNVECFLPMYTEQVLADGKARAVKPQVLFPRYIFARFDPEVIHTTTIKATRGVSTIVNFGGRQAILPDDVMAALQSRAGAVPEPERSPLHGERVRITTGVFEHFEAIWHEPKGDGRAMLLLNMLGGVVRLPLNGSRAKGVRIELIAQERATC